MNKHLTIDKWTTANLIAVYIGTMIFLSLSNIAFLGKQLTHAPLSIAFAILAISFAIEILITIGFTIKTIISK